MLTIGRLVNYVVSQLVKKTGLIGMNRVLGGGVGIFRGLLIASSLFFFLDSYLHLSRVDFFQKSIFIPYLIFISKFVINRWISFLRV